MHEVEYEHVKFELPNPLNSSKYVGITDDVENAWMDVAYRKSTHFPTSTISRPSKIISISTYIFLRIYFFALTALLYLSLTRP